MSEKRLSFPTNLARKFRFAMHLYGLTEDVGLLLTGKLQDNAQANPHREGAVSILGKIFALLMVFGANFLSLYVFTVHLHSEYRALELRRSQLGELFESLRSHLSRFFSLALALTWHLSCPQFERLFLDFQRYYASFTRGEAANCFQKCKYEDGNNNNNNRLVDLKQQGREDEDEEEEEDEEEMTISESDNFYRLASQRIQLVLLLPPLHFVLNLLAVCTFPNSSVGPTAVAGRRVEFMHPVTPALPANSLLASIVNDSSRADGIASSAKEKSLSWASSHWQPEEILQSLVRNFHTFHSSIETAFHRLEEPEKPAPIRSALYCLAELAVYSMYFNGPRIVCATCLSLILHMHHLCIGQLQRILIKLLQAPKSRPLSPNTLVKLVKRYDLIRLMHERIERTFKWSIMLWFSLMFISCLMHIFSLTEMTTITFYSTTAPATPADTPADRPHQHQQQPHRESSGSALSVILFRFTSALFVIYSPALIYKEAFRIEAASNRVEQLVMRLSRRAADPLAQSIELSLFEPICLSVGEYFRLSKRSLSALLGAFVTFSVMFIAKVGTKPDLKLTSKIPEDTGDDSATSLTSDGDGDPIEEDDNDELLNSSSLDEDEDDITLEDDLAEDERIVESKKNILLASNVDSEEEEEEEEEEEDENEEDIVAPLANQNNLGLDEKLPVQSTSLRESSSRKTDKEELTRIESGKTEQEKNKKTFQVQRLTRFKARQRRKLKNRALANLKQHQLEGQASGNSLEKGIRGRASAVPQAAPRLAAEFFGKIRENERMVELSPKLRVLNDVEVCDFELLPLSVSLSLRRRENISLPDVAASQIPFLISWIDRVSGQATLEARAQQLMDCERQQNYTFKMRALGCNGLQSNEATVYVHTEDVNEFSPEFERLFYSISLDWPPPAASAHPDSTGAEQTSKMIPLLNVVARDSDCSREFGSVCRYELLPAASAGAIIPMQQQQQQQPQSAESLEGLSVDAAGLIQMSLPVNSNEQREGTTEHIIRPGNPAERRRRSFQVIAYDCAGKKSQSPAQVELKFNHVCKPALKDVDSRIMYKPLMGEKSPFLSAHLDICGVKCHRPNISVLLQLQTGTSSPEQSSSSSSRPNSQQQQQQQQQTIHCDRDTYSMVSRRRLCGARLKSIELLPPLGSLSGWLLPPTTQTPLTGYQASRLEPEVWDSDGDSLNEYSPDGSYGKRAFRFAYAQSWRGPEATPSSSVLARRLYQLDSDPTTPSHASGESSPTPGRRTHRRHHHYRAGGGHRRIGARHASAFRQGRESQPSDPSSVYRDRVYRFEGGGSGKSGGLLIPQSVWKSAVGQALMFGREHSISFWMRHSHSTPTQVAQHGTHSNGSSSGHREHLLCATLPPPAEQQPAEHDEQTSGQTATPSSRHSRLHHLYALSVHNCKLVLLMRRWPGELEPILSSSWSDRANESTGRSEDTYLPSEWRWTLAEGQTCDDHWHLYTINVRYPSVELYVDGQQFEETYDTLVIVDDLPLPLPARGPPSFWLDESEQREEEGTSSSISLSLGSCWDPRAKFWSGAHFRGYLSGLSVLVNSTEDPHTVVCMGRCSEALVSTASTGGGGSSTTLQDQDQDQDQQQQQQQQAQPASTWQMATKQLDNSLVAYQESPARILLNGHDFFDIEDALSQIAYVNKRPLPSIGQRFIKVTTSIECLQQQSSSSFASGISSANSSVSINIPPISVKVDVQPSSTLPLIQLTGTPNLAREYAPYIRGIKPFSSLNVRIKRLNLFLNKRNKHLATDVPGDLKQTNELKPLSQDQSNAQSSTRPPTSPVPPEPAPAAQSLTALPDLSDYIDDESTTTNSEQSGDSLQVEDKTRRIEACTVRLYPPLNGLHESLLLPVQELEQLQLYWRQTHNGLAIYGLDSVSNYERLLREIIYKNTKPALYLERVFRLVCSDLNGRLVSNEYLQTVTVIHLKPLDESANESELITATKHSIEVQPSSLRQSELTNIEGNSLSHLSVLEPFSLKRSRQDIRYFQPLSLAQSSRLDRIAVAFLVFLVSLVVIVLIIALTNLKERPSTRSKGSRRSGKKVAFSKDGFSDRERVIEDGCYASEDDEEEEEEEEVDVEDEEEEEEEEEADGEENELYTKMSELQQRHCSSPNTKSQKNPNQDLKSSSKFYPLHDSTDIDSLSWDDGEQFTSFCDKPNIVINPLHQEAEGAIRGNSKQLLAIQRPDANGAIKSKPESQLTNRPKMLTEVQQLFSSKSIDRLDEYNLEKEEFFCDKKKRRGRQDNGCFSGESSSNSDFGSNSDSSNSSSFDDDENSAVECSHLHRFHRNQHILDDAGDAWLSTMEREAVHEHDLHLCHYYHHNCLRLYRPATHTNEEVEFDLGQENLDTTSEGEHLYHQHHHHSCKRLVFCSSPKSASKARRRLARRRERSNSA